MPASIDPGSVVHWNIEWTDDGGMNAKEHADYLVKFGEEFYNRLVVLIERAINKLMKITANKCVKIFYYWFHVIIFTFFLIN